MDKGENDKKIWEVIFKIQGSIIIILNTFVIIVIITHKKLRRKLCHKFLCSFLFVHLLIGIFSMAITNIAQFETDIDHITSMVIARLLNLLIVTMDRFICIKYPYRYQNFTTKNGICMILGAWLLALGYMPLSLLIEKRYTGAIVRMMLLIVAFLALVMTNAIVYDIVRKQIKKISETLIDSAASKKHYKLHQEKKSFKMCFMLIASFIILLTPLLIFNITLLIQVQTKCFIYIVILIAYFDDITSPIIYSTMNKELNATIKKILSKRQPNKQSDHQ